MKGAKKMPPVKRIEDHFDSGEEFADALSEATKQARGRALDFLIELGEKWAQYGVKAYLSDRQYDYLALLAGIEGSG
jgi:hypothetical protein